MKDFEVTSPGALEAAETRAAAFRERAMAAERKADKLVFACGLALGVISAWETVVALEPLFGKLRAGVDSCDLRQIIQEAMEG